MSKWASHQRKPVFGRTEAVLSLILFGFVVGCDKSSPAPPVTTDEQTMPAAAPAAAVEVVVSGDTRGWIMPCGCTANQSGGLLRRATYVRQLQKSGEVVLLDCGGAAEGTTPYQQARFRAILLGEKQMGVEAHNIGQSEADFGVATLKELARDTGILLISANLRTATGEAIVPSSTIIERGGQRLLITGVTSLEQTAHTATESAAENATELTASEPSEAILKVVREQAGQYDRVIVLAWLPVDELRQLAETLPEVDVIVGGPTGQSLPPERIGQVLLTSATNKGKFLAKLTFPAAFNLHPTAEIIELTPSFADDELQKTNLDAFRSMLATRDFDAKESGFVDAWAARLTSSTSVAGTAACRECHQEACSAWDNSGHSHAWATLESQKAHVDPYCQQCHTTGYGMPDGFASLKAGSTRVNVGCESCHGPAQSHVRDPSVRTPFDAKGACIRCHDHENSPHFKFDGYWEKVHHE